MVFCGSPATPRKALPAAQQVNNSSERCRQLLASLPCKSSCRSSTMLRALSLSALSAETEVRTTTERKDRPHQSASSQRWNRATWPRCNVCTTTARRDQARKMVRGSGKGTISSLRSGFLPQISAPTLLFQAEQYRDADKFGRIAREFLTRASQPWPRPLAALQVLPCKCRYGLLLVLTTLEDRHNPL